MMIKTIEALQGLYVALGGDLADVANITIIPEMLLAISKVAATAASELPAVKAADNGKVLTVVSGAWAKADLPKELPAVTNDDNGDILKVVSGEWAKADAPTNAPFVVTISEDVNRHFTSDKTFAEITAALAANKRVVMNFSSVYEYPTFENCTNVPLSIATSTRYYFSVFRVGDGDVELIEFWVASDNSVSESSVLK